MSRRPKSLPCLRALSLISAGLLVIAGPVAADGTRDCPSQLAGLGSLVLSAATDRPSCRALPAAGQLGVTVVSAEASGSSCGRCIKITDPARTFDAVIVGETAATASRHVGDLVLSQTALASTGLVAGGTITWVSVPCAATEPITIGITHTSARELNVDLTGYRSGLAKVSLASTTGPRPLERDPRGRFAYRGDVGPAPWTLVLEDVHGRTLEIPGLKAGTNHPTGAQFPACKLLFSDGFEGGDLSTWGRRSGP